MIDEFFRMILYGKNDVKKDVNLDRWIQSVCGICFISVFYTYYIFYIYIQPNIGQENWRQ